ncbi:cysteine desulfurase [Candidatus Berkelbacteria bacterium]|nr:cysteine desulfurase [Candidatus Berkelbacteria bacterium]
MKFVYADNAASTQTDERVLRVISETANNFFANPSSAHALGKNSAEMLSNSRQTVADFIGAKSDEIYFCSSGSEAINLAILGTAKASTKKHIITTKIEHPAVKNTCLSLEKSGYNITYLDVDSFGFISVLDLKKSITNDTLMFVLAYGNSEIGTLADVKAISEICHERGILVVVDACQSAAYLPLNINDLGADLLIFNGSKMYGPKGVSALYVKEGINIFPIIYGGGQEKSLRSGTENLAAVCGLAKACQIAKSEHGDYTKIISDLNKKLVNELKDMGVKINAETPHKLPNHISVIIENTDSTDLVQSLSELGVYVSSGSACSQKSQTESHVLNSIGLKSDQINKTIRITLGKYSQKEDINAIIEAIKKIQRG